MIQQLQNHVAHYLKASPSIPLIILLALVFQLNWVTLLISPLQAQTQYVIPSAEIPVRRGQATDYKIVALVKDGAKVELLERGESYSLIRLENEKEGWILTRFLSDDPPLTQRVAELTSENETLKLRQEQSAQQLANQEQQNAEQLDALNLTLTETRQTLETTDAEKAAVAASYDKLKHDTANVVEIKKQMKSTIDENKTIKQKLTSLTRENDELKSDERINWFLAGGGVLLLGIIIGKITSRSRKRKPSLL